MSDWHTDEYPELRSGPPWVTEERVAGQPELAREMLSSPPEGLADLATAIREFQEALADKRSPLTEVQRKEAQDIIARARGFVGTVEVVLEPRGATLLVDMEETAARELLLDLGDYELRARAPG